jgi:hypothetical protein
VLRRPLALVLTAAALCSCADAVPPREPVPTPTPPTRAPRGYVDPGYGLCERLELPDLVHAIGTPGKVREEPGELDAVDVVHRVCRLWVGRGDHRAGVRVTVEVVIGRTFDASLRPSSGGGSVQEAEPISGWWSEGSRVVSRDITRPPEAPRILVDTVIKDRDLWAHVWVRNPRVRDEAERLATTSLGEVVLTRLRDQLTLEPPTTPTRR